MAGDPCSIIEYLEYDVIVPFVCHRCGNCCRRYYPAIEPELLPEIERIITKPISRIQERLMEDCEAHRSGFPADCFFLDSIANTCRIHDVKPQPCRVFPSLVASGAGKVDCPAHREHMRVVTIFSENGAKVRKPAGSRKTRPVPEREKQTVLRKLDGTGTSEMLRQKFVAANGIERSGP